MSNYSSQSTLAPAEHQKEYTKGQIIKFNIPSFYGFIDPRQTFLRFNVQLVSQLRGRLSKNLGAQALIHAIRIYDHSNAQLLENIENYGNLVKIKNVYGENESLKHQKQLLEGVDVENTDGTLDCRSSLFFNGYVAGGSVDTDLFDESLAMPHKVQIALKLHSGILGGDKVFPVSAFGGLRVEIELNSAVRSFMMAELGSDDAHPLKIAVAVGAGAVDDIVVDVPFVDCPYVVGEQIEIENTAGDLKYITITSLEHDDATLADGKTATKIGFDTQTLGACAIGKPTYIEEDTRAAAASALDFKLTNVELCVKQVNPPAAYINDMMKQIGSEEGFSIDIKTFDLVRQNIQAGQLINEQPIRSFSHRVYSVLSLMVENQGDSILSDSFATMTAASKLKSYAYMIDGKKNPNRDVLTELTTASAHHINQQSTFELHKALESCGITIRNLPLKTNFLIGRAMGRYGGVFRLVDRNLTLRSVFDRSTSSMLCLNYLCSLRRLNVSNKGIVVVP
tara:strand:- start:707 stop:2230 length:1524 start_codon:yes stop_codon:yes gene_type:complete